MESPILSIVIPSKNRPETLRYVLEYLASWKRSDLEIIVQDNSDRSYLESDTLRALLIRPGVRYFHCSAPLSAVENCNEAVRKASGSIVCFIGDDDAPTRHCIDICYWMLREEVDCVLSKAAGYTWPDMEHAISVNSVLNGRLSYRVDEGAIVDIACANELLKVAKCGAQSMHRLPRLYHGLVSKRLLDVLFRELGTYFPGPVPDMANAVAIAAYSTNAKYLGFPAIVSGQSAKSMSGRNSVRKHQGAIEDEPSLPKDTSASWDPRIPKYWCAPTIWAEAFLKAAEATGQKHLHRSFGFHCVIAACICYTRSVYWTNIIIPLAMFLKSRPFFGIPLMIFAIARIVVQRFFILLRKFTIISSERTYSDVGSAAKELDQEPLIRILLEKSGIVSANSDSYDPVESTETKD